MYADYAMPVHSIPTLVVPKQTAQRALLHTSLPLKRRSDEDF